MLEFEIFFLVLNLTQPIDDFIKESETCRADGVRFICPRQNEPREFLYCCNLEGNLSQLVSSKKRKMKALALKSFDKVRGLRFSKIGFEKCVFFVFNSHASKWP